MKRLRILTGRHAGAAIDLAPGRHLVGSDPDCQVVVSDWDAPTVSLTTSDDGRTIVERLVQEGSGTDPAPAGQSRELADFEPVKFGNAVVCLGPAQGAWPSDMALLDRVFETPPRRMARWLGTRFRAGRAVFFAGVTASMVCFFAWTVLAGAKAPPPPSPSQSLWLVRNAIAHAAPDRLDADLERDAIIVTGIVDSRRQANAVRDAIDAAKPSLPVRARYASADELAETLRGATGIPNAVVTYKGGGVFIYSASSSDPAATRASLDRLTNDLAPLVKRIDSTLRATVTGDDTPILAHLDGNGFSVVQTRDGAKHIMVAPTDAPTVTTSDALAIPTPPLQ